MSTLSFGKNGIVFGIGIGIEMECHYDMSNWKKKLDYSERKMCVIYHNDVDWMKNHYAVSQSVASGNTLKIMGYGLQHRWSFTFATIVRTQEVTHFWYFHSNLNVIAQRPFKLWMLLTVYARKLSIFLLYASCYSYWNTYLYRARPQLILQHQIRWSKFTV